MNAISGLNSVYALRESEMTEPGGISLDNRLIQAFSRAAVNSESEKKSILQKIEQAGTTTDPAELYSLQLRTSNYNLEVSLISTLTRKSVAVVETLLRS